MAVLLAFSTVTITFGQEGSAATKWFGRENVKKALTTIKEGFKETAQTQASKQVQERVREELQKIAAENSENIDDVIGETIEGLLRSTGHAEVVIWAVKAEWRLLRALKPVSRFVAEHKQGFKRLFFGGLVTAAAMAGKKYYF